MLSNTITITLSDDGKSYYVKSPGLIAIHDAREDQEAWVAMDALMWLERNPGAMLNCGPGVPPTLIPAGKALIRLLEENGFKTPRPKCRSFSAPDN